MAKEIDLTKQLSSFDLQYLVDRGRWDDLRENANNLGIAAPNLPSARGIRAQTPRQTLAKRNDAFDRIADTLGVAIERDEEGDWPTPDPDRSPVDFNKLTVPQLKEEMDKRRQQYELEQDSEGVELMTYAADAKKADLVAALEMDSSDDGEDA